MDEARPGPAAPALRVETVFPHARRPRWVKVASWALDRGMRLGVLRRDLDPDRLRAEAEAKTGLSDWGPDFREDALERLLASGRTDARLNYIGRAGLSGAVRKALSNWLRLVDARKRNPELLDVPVQRPVIIAAMPRTGSTFLHHLLVSHPDVRHLPMWLASHPLPAPSTEEWLGGGVRDRRRAADRNVRILNLLVPALKTIHPYQVDLPVECTHLMSVTFFSNQWAAWPLYSYFDWVAEQPLPSYAPYRQHLQLLQATLPGQGWVLKSPGHFIAMPSLYEAVPEALIVHLHRDPAEVMPSLNSMMACHQRVFSESLDFARGSRSFLEAFASAAERVIALRERVGAERFVDVGYRQLKADPLGVASEVFTRIGLRWDDEVRAALSAFVGRDRHRTGQRHDYPLAQYGQDPAMLRETFADYIDAFGVTVDESKG